MTRRCLAASSSTCRSRRSAEASTWWNSPRRTAKYPSASCCRCAFAEGPRLQTAAWSRSEFGDPRRLQRVVVFLVVRRLGRGARGRRRPSRRRDAEQVLDEEVPPLVIAVGAA